MLDVIIALMPALIAAAILFGPRVLMVATVAVSSAVFFEIVSQAVTRRDIYSVSDLSAVVTGLILALGLPANAPVLSVVLGTGVAIVLIKQLFGGLGRNLLNPALIGRVVAMQMAQRVVYPRGYPVVFAWWQPSNYQGADAVTTATPLRLLADGAELPGLWELALGIHPGAMGETAGLALIAGGVYLVWRRVISPVIPLIFVGTTLLTVTLAGQNP